MLSIEKHSMSTEKKNRYEQTGLEALAELPFYCTASSLYAVPGFFSGLLHL